jgi:competence protein ComEC
MLKSVRTRFRAYQVGCAGASYSYFADDHFTLIEAMATAYNKRKILEEMEICGKNYVDTLHITGWDNDHCSVSGLTWILENLHPRRIEYPGYDHDTNCATVCKKIIVDYVQARRVRRVKAQRIDPSYINGLKPHEGPGYTDIYYHPKEIQDNSNDNSTIKFFRKGSFNVLSLGDVQCSNISSMIRRASRVKLETDILILAHHGADNGFTTKKFLEDVKPSVAICSSNYDNQHDHPRKEIRDLLHEQRIPIYTTKTGDVIVESIRGHSEHYQITNLIGGCEKVSSVKIFLARKTKLLRMNADTIRARLHPGNRGPSRH